MKLISVLPVVAILLLAMIPGQSAPALSAQDQVQGQQEEVLETPFSSQSQANDTDTDQLEEEAKLKIPPGVDVYMGRRVAMTMGHQGADWLIRDEREREERCSLMLANLGVKRGMTICDMGCGNGFYALQLAQMTGKKGYVVGVDIQPEMLSLLRDRMEEEGVENIIPILGSYHNPHLPENLVDLILLVDVYHEFSHPEQMLASMRKSLKPDGLAVFLEYRKEDPKVPIKPLHKMSKAQVNKELNANGFKLVKEFDDLPWQHMMFFGKDEEWDGKVNSEQENDNSKVDDETGQTTLEEDYGTIVELQESFYQEPTEERLNELASLLIKHQEKITPRSKIGVLSAVALGRAVQKSGWKIQGECPVLNMARDIGTGEKEENLNAMFGVDAESDNRKIGFWKHSFFGSGDVKYLDLILNEATDYTNTEYESKAQEILTISADSTLMYLAREHEAVLEHLQSIVDLSQWTEKQALIKRYIAFATTGWDEGRKFDRTTAKGTLRLFYWGVLSQNEDLIAATSEPVSREDMKLLTESKMEGTPPPEVDFRVVAKMSLVQRLKQGDKWSFGKSEFTVTPEEDSDRGMTAYVGPVATTQFPPFQVFKIGGIWQVKSKVLISVRRSSLKARKENASRQSRD